MENICKFPGRNKVDDSIHVLNFVRENQMGGRELEVLPSVFSLRLTIAGTGRLCCGGSSFLLKPGTMYLTYPAKAYTLSCDDSFQFAYLEFIGIGVPKVLESFQFRPPCVVSPGHEEAIPFWLSMLDMTNADNHFLVSRSVLFYSLALMGTPNEEKKTNATHPAVRKILFCLEHQYFDENLSLEGICEQLKYNPNYVSRAFKQAVGQSYTEYLQRLRISHACELLAGSESIANIAFMVGFRDPLYFSRVFKKITSSTPMEYRQNLNK